MDWNWISYHIYISAKQLLSTRRVWIEIPVLGLTAWQLCCYSPHGEYGLKSPFYRKYEKEYQVTLHTESMDWNYRCIIIVNTIFTLLSTRRVWIEILTNLFQPYIIYRLLSTRRVWIEILNIPFSIAYLIVTLHTESMDWNSNHQ